MNSMETPTYHIAGMQDVPLLVDLRVEFLEEYWGEQPSAAREELKRCLRDYYTRAINDHSYLSYYAKADNTIVAIGGMIFRQQAGNFNNPSGRICYLMNMYTIPSYRRKGICSKILNLLIENARVKGVTAFELHATPEGEPVYLKHDFKKHGEPTYRKYFGKLIEKRIYGENP
jgi:GNAT superfamily N-acetyltransferase